MRSNDAGDPEFPAPATCSLRIVEARLSGYDTLIAEFLIDGTALSSLLHITRDLSNCGCDLDSTSVRSLPEQARCYVDELMGRRPASNQFGNGRTVLYRCHCGCDYCGVISCRIEATRDWIEWHDIALEDDSGPQSCADNTQKHPQLTLLPRLRFEKHAYRQELERLLSIAG